MIEKNVGDLKELDSFRKKMLQAINVVQAKFKEALNEDIDKAERLVYELQFLSKLMVSANRLEEKLLDY